MVEAERDFQRSYGPTPLLRQGHLELIAQGHAQMAFEYPQEWRLHNIPGQRVPVFGHPHRKKVFPDTQREPPVFQCAPMASCPITGHH